MTAIIIITLKEETFHCRLQLCRYCSQIEVCHLNGFIKYKLCQTDFHETPMSIYQLSLLMIRPFVAVSRLSCRVADAVASRSVGQMMYRLHGGVVKGVGHLEWEVVSSISNNLTIVGRVFNPTRQLVRFSHLNVPFFQNSEFIFNVVLVGKR